MQFQHALGQLNSVHLWHDDIGDEQIDRLPLADFERRRRPRAVSTITLRPPSILSTAAESADRRPTINTVCGWLMRIYDFYERRATLRKGRRES